MTEETKYVTDKFKKRERSLSISIMKGGLAMEITKEFVLNELAKEANELKRPESELFTHHIFAAFKRKYGIPTTAEQEKIKQICDESQKDGCSICIELKCWCSC